jgi:hypothetical protein
VKAAVHTVKVGGVKRRETNPMGLGTILIILLILALIGALPSWGYSRSWGYFPSGGLGLVLVIVIILVLMGRL